MQDTVTKLYRCVAEMKMKAELKDGLGPSKGPESRGVEGREGAIASPVCFKSRIAVLQLE